MSRRRIKRNLKEKELLKHFSKLKNSDKNYNEDGKNLYLVGAEKLERFKNNPDPNLEISGIVDLRNAFFLSILANDQETQENVRALLDSPVVDDDDFELVGMPSESGLREQCLKQCESILEISNSVNGEQDPNLKQQFSEAVTLLINGEEKQARKKLDETLETLRSAALESWSSAKVKVFRDQKNNLHMAFRAEKAEEAAEGDAPPTYKEADENNYVTPSAPPEETLATTVKAEKAGESDTPPPNYKEANEINYVVPSAPPEEAPATTVNVTTSEKTQANLGNAAANEIPENDTISSDEQSEAPDDVAPSSTDFFRVPISIARLNALQPAPTHEPEEANESEESDQETRVAQPS